MKTGREEKRHCKVGNCFYSKVLKLLNVMNQREENLKSLLVHFAKENSSRNKKTQPKLTKIKLNLNRANQN